MIPHSCASDDELSRSDRGRLTAELLAAAHTEDDATRKAALLDRVVVLNLRIARAVAARYRRRGVPLEDLEQAACEGLVKAVRRFDPATRNDLLTYAVPTIRGEIQRYFRDLSWTVRPPRRIQELQLHINRSLDELGHTLGREPTDDEMREHLAVDRAEYAEAINAFGCFQPPSLDQPAAGGADGAPSIGDAIADETDQLGPAEARTLISPVVRRLPERDRRILYLRFVEDQTQREIGEEFGVGQMQVSRWLSRIFERMRAEIAEIEPETAPSVA